MFTHGLTGYRFRPDSFYLNPSLPPQLGPDGYTVKGMKWQGSIFDVQVGLENTTITRRAASTDADAQNATVEVILLVTLVEIDCHCESNGRDLSFSCGRNINGSNPST